MDNEHLSTKLKEGIWNGIANWLMP